MNKILSAIFILHLSSISLANQIGPHATHQQDSNARNATLQQLLTVTDEQSKKLFGYNPQLELISEADATIQNPHEITIMPHGFGDSKEGVKRLKAYNAVYAPGTIITYNCPEIADGVMQLRKANFGQLPDMKPMLYALAQCQKVTDRIHLHGFSRGAALIINCIAALTDYKKYEKEFNTLDITPTDAQAIIRMIERGSVIFVCPLTDVKQTLTAQARSWSSIFAPLVGGSMNYLAPLATNYKLHGEQGIKSAHIAAKNNVRLNVLIHTEKNDVTVSNNPEFLKIFQEINPDHTYESKGNRNHNNRDPQFYAVLHLFNKKYNAAYSPMQIQR